MDFKALPLPLMIFVGDVRPFKKWDTVPDFNNHSLSRRQRHVNNFFHINKNMAPKEG
jgi:hypothetical protein